MPGTSNDGGKHGTWRVVSSKASFAHAGSVVNNEGGDFVFHFLRTQVGAGGVVGGGEEEEEGVYETGCSDSYALHLANIKPAGRERPCRSGKRTLDVAVAQDGSPESGP